MSLKNKKINNSSDNEGKNKNLHLKLKSNMFRRKEMQNRVAKILKKSK